MILPIGVQYRNYTTTAHFFSKILQILISRMQTSYLVSQYVTTASTGA
jgi:hypothetical protein